MAKKTASIFGCHVYQGSTLEALQEIYALAERKRFAHVTFVTASHLLGARVSRRRRTLLQGAHLLLPQGRGVRWAARVLRRPIVEFMSPIDIFMDVLRDSIQKKQTLFFLGSSPDTLNAAMSNLRKSFPMIRIIGSHHGYFDTERSKDIVQAIRKFAPAYLFVGLGHPAQDQFIQQHAKSFSETVCISVGHAFELCAGTKSRGPQWMRKAGLEGLYKALHNPLRLFRIVRLPVFFVLTLWDRVFGRRK